MKTKYQRLSKEEKKKLLLEYKKTPNGNYILGKLRNVLIYGILLYIYAVYQIIKSNTTTSYIVAASVFIIGSIFIFASIRLRIKNLTKFAVKKK